MIHTTNPMTRKPCGGTFQEMTRTEPARVTIGDYPKAYRIQTLSNIYYVCDRCGIGCDILIEDAGDRARRTAKERAPR